jgi:hypothetical protein
MRSWRWQLYSENYLLFITIDVSAPIDKHFMKFNQSEMTTVSYGCLATVFIGT